MTAATDTAVLTDLQGPLPYWGPAAHAQTPTTAHPRRVVPQLTPLQLAARQARARRTAALPLAA